MMKNNRGQIRVIEALLSAVIIFSALAICSALPPPSDNGNQMTVAAQGMQALVKLDSDGTLGKMIGQGNWTALSDSLQLLLPIGISYNLTVYDQNMQQISARAINSVPISNGNLVGNVDSVEYLCASQNLQYQYYRLRLQLAVVK